MASIVYKNERQKEFGKTFDSLCGAYSRWNIWSDFISMSAFSISNCIDGVHREEREEKFAEIEKRYTASEMEKFAHLLAITVQALEENPNQDFLGELYMNLDLGNKSAGQFFTPYHICEMMSEITSPPETLKAEIEEKGWVSVNDPCVGGGAMLVGYANACLKYGINYQQSVLFVGQDIDFTVAKMAYIQLSLLGCAGYIVIGNSLTEPCISPNGSPLFAPMEREVYITPMYCSEIWEWRRQAVLLKQIFAALDIPPKEEIVENEPAPAPESEPESESEIFEPVQLSLFD